MDQRERAEEFLKELTILRDKYDFEVTGEGNSPLLYDEKEGGWIEFGTGAFGGDYKIYETTN